MLLDSFAPGSAALATVLEVGEAPGLPLAVAGALAQGWKPAGPLPPAPSDLPEAAMLSWLAETAPERRILGLIAFGDTVKQTAKTAIADTTAWHHVAVTKSGSDVHLYLDGQDVTKTVTNLTVVNAPAALTIAAGASRFNGGIDEVSLYPTALSASAIAAHFAAATSG